MRVRCRLCGATSKENPNEWVQVGSEPRHFTEACLRRQLARYRERVAELERERADHGPNGRNVTNEQYVALREQNRRLRSACEDIANGSYSGEQARDIASLALLERKEPEVNGVKIEIHDPLSGDSSVPTGVVRQAYEAGYRKGRGGL